MKMKGLSLVLVALGMGFANAPAAFGFFSSTGTKTNSAVYSAVATCATNSFGRAQDGMFILTCDAIARDPAEIYSDAEDLSQIMTDTDDCKIVDEALSAVDNFCLDQAVSAYDEDGNYAVLKWKLHWRPTTTSAWNWAIIKFKARQIARMERFCGSNGPATSLLAWLPTPAKRRICNSTSAYGYCDSTFSTTTMPQCNQDCRAADDALCDRGNTNTCDLNTNSLPTCPSTYDGIASYCSTNFSGCAPDWCDAQIQVACNLPQPEVR